MKYKYVNYFNDEFIFSESKSLKNRYLTLPSWIYDKYVKPINNINIHSMYATINFSINGVGYNMAYFETTSSGLKDNDNKRILLPKKLFFKENLIKNKLFNNLIVIAVYNAGNKCCYIRFGTDLNPFINEDDFSLDKKSSVKLDFGKIAYCLKNDEKIKYYETYFKIRYPIYLSTKFDDLLEINENEFKKVTNNEIEKIKFEINECRKKYRQIYSGSDSIINQNSSIFFKKENYEFDANDAILVNDESDFDIDTNYWNENKQAFINNRKLNFDFKEESLIINNNCEKIEDIIGNRDKRISDNQKKFRDNLLIIYESKCILTDINLEPVLKVSYIKSWINFKENELDSKYDINNGLLLVSPLSNLFDRFLISFDETGKLYIPKCCSKNTSYTKENIIIFLKKLGVSDYYLYGKKSVFEKIINQFEKFSDSKLVASKYVPNLSKIKEKLKEHFEKSKELTY